jgi:hypothetical protein
MFLRVVAAAAALVVLASCGADSGESADSTAPAASTTSASAVDGSATPVVEESPLEPFCADLVAAVEGVPPLDPKAKQIYAVKQAIEEARPRLTGKVAREVEDWYDQTTDLAVAQFNRAADEAAYTTAWAEWTMGAKVGIRAVCSA